MAKRVQRLTDTQLRLLKKFRQHPRKPMGYIDVCIHESNNRGGRFSYATFEALQKKELIEPSYPAGWGHTKKMLAPTWYKVTQAGIDRLKKEKES